MELFNLFFDVFWGFFGFLDSLLLFGGISVLKLLIIMFLFLVAFKFLFPHSKGD